MLVIRNEKGEIHSILIFLFMSAISLFFLTMNYDVLKDIKSREIKDSSTTMERVIEEFAPEYRKEKSLKTLRLKIASPQKGVYPPNQDSGGTVVLQKESPVLKTASIKSDNKQNTPVKKEKRIKSTAGPVFIKDIAFRKAKNRAESVLIYSDRFFEPTVFGLEGNNPYGASLRMVVDIKNTSYLKKGDSKIDVNGEFIKRIRSRFNENSLMLRIVLDLEPAKIYMADQIFLKDENIYILVLTEEKKTGGKEAEYGDKKPKDIVALEPNYNQYSFKKRQQERRPLADPVEIEDITFREAKNGTDTVLIRSNRFFEPTIFALEGKKPRLVVDIKNASYVGKGLSTIDIDGKMIKRIRSRLDGDSHILRIVLDLESSKGFMVKRSFHKDENLYSLEVIGEDWREGKEAENKDERPEANIQKSYVEKKENDNIKRAVRIKGDYPSRDIRAEGIQTVSAKIDNMIPWSLSHKIKEGKRNQFRREGKDLNANDVKAMLSQYNFYSTCMGYNASFCNQDGNFNNDFNDNSNGTITDKTTRLMWQKSGSLEGVGWEKARRYVSELNRQNFAGYSDWRLPTLEELASLMEGVWKNGDLFIEAVFDRRQKSCWSMDTYGSHKAWKINFHLGYIIDSSCTSKNSVRAVRSIQSSPSFISQERSLYQYQTREVTEKR